MSGSKQGTFSQIQPLLPVPDPGRGYVLPFFGTGADAQYLTAAGHRIAACSDANPHLVRALWHLRDRTDETLAAVDQLARAFAHADLGGQRHGFKVARDVYNAVADPDPGEGTPQIAALFLGVWRAGFNGLIRANSRGVINVPPGMTAKTGRKSSLIDMPSLTSYAAWLKTIPRVLFCDYSHTLTLAQTGDVVYADPPYYGTFDGYFGKRFDTARLLTRLSALPVSWAMSNSREVPGAFPDMLPARTRCYPVKRSGRMSCKGAKREPVIELLAVCEPSRTYCNPLA